MSLIVSSCSKNDAPKQKSNIVASLKSFSLSANSSGQVRGVGAVWIDDNGSTRSLTIDIGPDASLKNGTTTINNTDIVADNSQIIASNISNVAAIINATTPNSLKLVLDANSDVQSATLNVTSNTIVYLGDNSQFPTYTLHQLDSAFRAVANQIPALYSQITFH